MLIGWVSGVSPAHSNMLSFDSSMEVHTVLALTFTDAFICCWDEKYRSNRIRPETAIRLYIDPQWKPLLQTPPFPEYISGHSVVSGASAEILSHYFGDHFAYRDSVEQDFGLPPRSFQSFRQAAQEAARIPLLWRYSFYGCQQEWIAARRKDRKIYIIRIFQKLRKKTR